MLVTNKLCRMYHVTRHALLVMVGGDSFLQFGMLARNSTSKVPPHRNIGEGRERSHNAAQKPLQGTRWGVITEEKQVDE